MSDRDRTETTRPTIDQWSITTDRETGRPLEIVLADNPDIRVCFLASDGKWSTAKLIAAAPDLAVTLAALVEMLNARPDIWRLCGFHEVSLVKAACNALNMAST